MSMAFRDVRLLHDGRHTPPSGGAGPDPQGLIEFVPPAPALDFGEARHHVERNWHGSLHAFAAFFEASTTMTWWAESTRLGVRACQKIQDRICLLR
jgi:hypothetical protein